MICKICAQSALPLGTARLLGKHTIQYFRCGRCGFIQTETPYWLEEAYAQAINDSDIGLVQRNLRLAKISKAVVCLFFDPGAKFMDYGGGYGLFVRLMRDAGFDFYRFDKYCPNLFARTFEATLDIPGRYELVTAFEVFEHFTNPLQDVEGLLRFSKNILFSTELIPPHTPQPEAWWYYGLDHGQHVALYTRKSLEIMAQSLGLNLYSDDRRCHLLSERRLPGVLFKLIARQKAAAVLAALFRRQSLIPADYRRITGRDLS